MDLNEARKLKIEAQNQIFTIIHNFAKQTGTHVKRVELIEVETTTHGDLARSGRTYMLSGVELETEL